ncbi:MAG: tRNA pseudouridine(38-40) synthase TruA [Clostridia bacterium]
MTLLPSARNEISAPPPRRVLLTLSYDGTAYAGWQRQQNAMTVQQKVEDAFYKLTGEQISMMGASRTDAGVHALGQCAHFDTLSRIPADKLPFALNTCLPRDIRILGGRDVPANFHARFDAKGKRYTYRIHNERHASALYRNLYAHVPQRLDVALMQQSLTLLVGTHDFAAFQAAGGTARSTLRTIRELSLTQQGNDLTLTISGNAFLYNMVRIIVGSMLDIGSKRVAPNVFELALATGDRLKLGVTAPACGLELTEVFYER